ncbi:MAG: hypothetical protein ACRC7N_07910 [Clostridium sp.]
MLLIIFLLTLLFKKGLETLPKKIKPYMLTVIVLFLIRYIVLFLFGILPSGGIVYYLRPIVYLNHLAIPLMIICLTYVFSRPEKVPFMINYIVGSILTIIYLVAITLIKGRVGLNPNYGYIISLENNNYLNIISLIVLGGLLILNVLLLDKPNNNRLGIIYLLVAIFLVMVENVIHLGGIRLFPYPILGDGIFILIMSLAFKTFNKKV